LHPVTIPLAELLLTKAQIAELNRKDALDIASLLLYAETGSDDMEKINLKRIAQLCGADWGLYKTTSINLKRVEEIVSEEKVNLTEAERGTIKRRIGEILQTFASMPKSLAWQMRDKVGTRVRWYEEVEEVAR
jgi:predicted hydrocarbon binding protein